MSVAGLFSGIGGFELAFTAAGFSCDLLVEIDPAARAVLEARFPGADLRADVLDLKELPKNTSVLTAGFPCQNLSMAGDKAGIDGAKSGVIKKLFELIRRSRVPIVVIENVYFMLHLDSGAAMKWLVGEFEDLNYKWAYRVIDTMGFGLPQRRRRVYFVASLNVDPRSILFAEDRPPPSVVQPTLERPLGFYWTEGRSGIGLTVDGIPPLKVGSSVGIPSAPAVLFPDGEVLMPSLTACERLQGFVPGWTDVPAFASLKRNPRWRLVGNAVSVPAARWVADRIKSPSDTIPDFRPMSTERSRRWSDAGWNVGEGRVNVMASDQPSAASRLSIDSFRDENWTRFSDRALDGFVTRAVEGGLRVPDGFLDALRVAVRKSSERDGPRGFQSLSA